MIWLQVDNFYILVRKQKVVLKYEQWKQSLFFLKIFFGLFEIKTNLNHK